MNYPFHWLDGSTVSISATSASAQVALAKQPTGRFQLRIYNAGPSATFIKKGADSTVTAATTDFPIPSGGVEVFTVNNTPAAPMGNVAAICAGSGTATVYFSIGLGD